MQAIAPSDPAHINLYFVGVAGDGTQEVFHREVDYVRRQFERDFGAGGRSISLINSRATVDTAPMATRTSLRETLHTVAQKMDRQRDILFLFLTSHGTPEHELVLDQEGIMIPMLPAKTLAALVNEQQFRWKVIVVSACYAGGFIAPLQDDHTLIITAARKDRSSFGCADDNEFTYFGRAFFKEALPRSSSFEQAFERARAIITSWEDADRKAAPKGQGVAYSYPQLFAPAPISAYLRQWWSQAAQH